MSTIRADNIGPSAGGTTTDLLSGLSKAWVNFDGAAGTLSARKSFNISSLTDNGTGHYQSNFTNSFSDANFVTSDGSSTYGTARLIGLTGNGYTQTTSSRDANYGTSTNTVSGGMLVYDPYYILISIHGDLA